MVKGERLIIFPAYEEYQFRITQFGDEIEALELIDPVSGEVIEKVNELEIFPAKHYLTDDHQRLDILKEIQDDMYREVASLEAKGKLVEAQRLRQRTMFDIEMIQETGSVAGIENYSRYFDRRQSGSPPSVLLDYFPADYLLMIDESHMTVPQISGMYHGDRSRKQTLVDFGFRLEAAKDNRPLTFAEFEERRGQTVFVSATPGPFEREQIDQEGRRLRLETGSTPNLIVEQLIRPTGILDPQVEVRPTEGQVKDLLGEIEKRVLLQERVLVTTLTKRMSEDLNMYLLEKGVKVQYLHSDVETIERSNILRDLRLGVYDVIVGINLLREGLDLPEVSLVAILDADKEGFLRSDTALIQTIGRAARHPDGKVIMYADRITGSMQRAIAETERRREIQEAYNSQHGIVPQRMVKSISTALPTRADLEVRDATAEYHNMSAKERAIFLDELREKMRQAALQLDYEQAAELRDQIRNLQR
jgi:excinuclease ABC subunit B